MKRYQCHKVVEAAKVTAAEKSEPSGDWECVCDDGQVYAADGKNKITEDNLGYIVRYEDGYQSWSPTKAFEDGYTELIDG